LTLPSKNITQNRRNSKFKKRKRRQANLSAIDGLAASLLEQAKRFLEKAEAAPDDIAQSAFLNAALMLAFCALEAHVNATADEFAERPELSIHERALLMEQDIRFEFGELKMAGLRMVRLEDRILFLHLRFGGKPLDRSAIWWSDLSAALVLRNKLTHPKAVPTITVDAVRRAIQAIIAVIDALFQAVYHRPFPVANRGLHSRITF
jgi:hypothetical protein